MTPLVAVFDRPMIRGIARPDYPVKGATYDWRAIPGSPENNRRIASAGKVFTFQAACETQWNTDAHFVAYVMHDAAGEPVATQPRVQKNALPWVESLGFSLRLSLLVADIDNPGHASWTQDGMLAHEDRAEKIDAFRRGAWYYTAHGLRLVHALNRALSPLEAEPALDAWHDELERESIQVDRVARDWTRFFRLPWVRRRDGALQEQIVDLDGLVPRDPPAVSGRVRTRRRSNPQVVGSVDFVATLPEQWRSRAEVIAEAVKNVATAWHPLFLKLAGALCQRGVAVAIIPAIIAAVSTATAADTKSPDRVNSARTTVQKFLAQEPIAGTEALQDEYPGVAAALDQVLGAVDATPSSPLPTAAQAAEQLTVAILDAPDGVSLIAAECGIGKTRGAVAMALANAKRGRTPTGRAKGGSKTAISEPTNAMARQVATTIRAGGGVALRVFSPASELDEYGAPVCKFSESARPLAAAGLSVPWELCDGRDQDPCPHRATCPAASGQQGDQDAHIVVGNHGLLGGLVAHAGPTGVRVIDEPPQLLETHALVATDFAAAYQHQHCFDPTYWDAVSPALAAFNALLHTMPMNVSAQNAEDMVSGEVMAAATSTEADRGPRLRWMHVRRAREQASFASDISRGARATWILWNALTSPAKWVVRREDRGSVPTLLFTGPNLEFVRALRAEGRTVVLDASPDVAVLSKVVGYDLSPRTTRVAASDGAAIRRTHLEWSNGTRRKLIENGQPRVEGVVSALRAAIAWATEDPECKTLGLITLAPIRAALDVVLRKETRSKKLPARVITEAMELLSPILARWGGTVVTGHYGAVRGLDDWKDVDALITIGDPWPNLGDVQNDVAYLGDTSEAANGRLEWLARVELEQAHGRIRAPHRDRPARALHVGRLRPLGAGWTTGVEVRALASGRPTTEAATTPERLREWVDRVAKGSVRGAAKLLGCDHETVRRYLDGRRAIPTAVAKHVSSGAETAIKESIIVVSAPLNEVTLTPSTFGATEASADTVSGDSSQVVSAPPSTGQPVSNDHTLPEVADVVAS